VEQVPERCVVVLLGHGGLQLLEFRSALRGNQVPGLFQAVDRGTVETSHDSHQSVEVLQLVTMLPDGNEEPDYFRSLLVRRTGYHLSRDPLAHVVERVNHVIHI